MGPLLRALRRLRSGIVVKSDPTIDPETFDRVRELREFRSPKKTSAWQPGNLTLTDGSRKV